MINVNVLSYFLGARIFSPTLIFEVMYLSACLNTNPNVSFLSHSLTLYLFLQFCGALVAAKTAIGDGYCSPLDGSLVVSCTLATKINLLPIDGAVSN